MHELAHQLVAAGSGRLVADYFSPVRHPGEFDAGRQLMLDAVLAGQLPELALLLARATDAQRDGGAGDQGAGAMDALCSCLDALQAGGAHLAVADAERWPGVAVQALRARGAMRRAVLRMTAPEDYGPTLALLCAAVRAAGPYLKRYEPAAPPVPAAPAPTPVSVSVALKLPDGPVPVAIVSQPATRTVGTVDRGADGRISTTTTVTTIEPVAP